MSGRKGANKKAVATPAQLPAAVTGGARLKDIEISQIENLLASDVTSFSKLDSAEAISSICRYQAMLSVLYNIYKSSNGQGGSSTVNLAVDAHQCQQPTSTTTAAAPSAAEEEARTRAAKVNRELFELRHEHELLKKANDDLRKELAASKRLANDFQDQIRDLRDALAKEAMENEENEDRDFNERRRSFGNGPVDVMVGSIGSSIGSTLTGSFSGSSSYEGVRERDQWREREQQFSTGTVDKKDTTGKKITYSKNLTDFLRQTNSADLACGSIDPKLLKTSSYSRDSTMNESPLTEAELNSSCGPLGRKPASDNGQPWHGGLGAQQKLIAGSCGPSMMMNRTYGGPSCLANSGYQGYQSSYQGGYQAQPHGYGGNMNRGRIVCGSQVEANPFSNIRNDIPSYQSATVPSGPIPNPMTAPMTMNQSGRSYPGRNLMISRQMPQPKVQTHDSDDDSGSDDE